jgi:hypothetical protein
MERQRLVVCGDQNRWSAVLNCTLPDSLVCTNMKGNPTMEGVNGNGILEFPQEKPVMLSGCTMTSRRAFS